MNKLDALVEQWRYQTVIHKYLDQKWRESVGMLSRLNSDIYKECQEQGIDIETLKLNED